MKYTVVAPILGIVSCSVEADSEDEALEKAFEERVWRMENWEAVKKVSDGLEHFPGRNEAYVERGE